MEILKSTQGLKAADIYSMTKGSGILKMQDAKGDGYYKQTYDSYPAGPLETEMIYKVSF